MSHKQKTINAWLKSSEEDLEVAGYLFRNKKYAHCLYFCQLALEKLLKALYIKQKDKYPIPTHDLVRLAAEANLDLEQGDMDYLAEITTFNVEARYDIFKEKLHKKATLGFTEEYLDLTKKFFTKFKQLL